MPFAVWITGLPGAGKSTISAELIKMLSGMGVCVEYMRLDAIRKQLIAQPRYDDAERDHVYSKLVDIAKEKIDRGLNVLIDATAHKRAFRDAARKKLENFSEVKISCDLDICIEREGHRPGGLVTADLYTKALERKKGKGYEVKGLPTGQAGIGEVVGVDVPFEEGTADLVIDSGTCTPAESAGKIVEHMKERGMINV